MPRSAKKVSKAEKSESVTSIKAFDHNLSCRGFQFEVGKTYKVEGKIVACQNGFHAVDAENPFHAWDFYPVVDDQGRLSRYATVLQAGEISRETDEKQRGTKIASAEITVKAELALPDFIKRAINAVIAMTKGKEDSAKIGSSGYYAQIGSSGYYAQIGSSGYSAQIGSSGDSAKIGSSGYYAKIVAEGKDAVIASAGMGAVASGIEGTWLSLAEYDDHGKCVGFSTGCIGIDGLKPNTPYRARGGKLVEAI